MLLSLLISLFGLVFADDTLDVATVSVRRKTTVTSLSPVRNMSEYKMERLGTSGLAEVVDMFSGVSIKDYGGIGGLKTVSVRNMGASHTSVIYDGIAVSDAQNGQVDISRFSLDDIASVSMSICMEDDIFCSARHLTSAGVLRIESTMPSFADGPTGAGAGVMVGSFGTVRPYLKLSRKLGNVYAMKVSAGGTFSNGAYPFILRNGNLVTEERRINSDVESYNAEADLYADWNDRGSMKVKVNYFDSERGLPGSVVLYTQNAYARLWDRSLISSVMYDLRCRAGWKFHADAGFMHSYNRHLDTNPVYPEPQDDRYSQNEYSVAARALYAPSENWELVVAEDMFVNELSSNIHECPFPVRLSSVSALSGRYEGERLNLSASLVGTFVTESLRIGKAPDDRFRISPVVGLSWNVYDGIRLRASYKEGFRVPTFNDLYYARVGNVNLRPETARQFNAGLTFGKCCRWGSVDVMADGYCNLIRDKITAVPSMFIWKMRNIGTVRMYGVDLDVSANLRVARDVSLCLDGNYSLQYALDVTDSESKTYRHQIPYTPRHCGSGSLTVAMPWLNVTYRVNASGIRYSKDQNIPSNVVPAYGDHCISLNRNFEFGRRRVYKLYFSLECLNLTGNNYEIIHYYPMPGRSYRLTLKFKC